MSHEADEVVEVGELHRLVLGTGREALRPRGRVLLSVRVKVRVSGLRARARARLRAR
jgi:hypothetical protein